MTQSVFALTDLESKTNKENISCSFFVIEPHKRSVRLIT